MLRLLKDEEMEKMFKDLVDNKIPNNFTHHRAYVLGMDFSRLETAREIFREIELNHATPYCTCGCWESLKSRYLTEGK